MYNGNINDEELALFLEDLYVPNFTIKLSTALNSDLFQVETIKEGSIYKLYPLFNTKTISSTNPEDKIFDNKMIICTQQEKETRLSFISDPEAEVEDYIEYGEYYELGHQLTQEEFNGLISLLRHFRTHDDPLTLKQGLINGKYADYNFNINGTTITDKGILITRETLANLGTVTMTNNKFHWSTYTLELQVYHVTDYNITEEDTEDSVIETLEVVLEPGVETTIPFDKLDYDYVVLFGANVHITHDKPVLWESD